MRNQKLRCGTCWFWAISGNCSNPQSKWYGNVVTEKTIACPVYLNNDHHIKMSPDHKYEMENTNKPDVLPNAEFSNRLCEVVKKDIHEREKAGKKETLYLVEFVDKWPAEKDLMRNPKNNHSFQILEELTEDNSKGTIASIDQRKWDIVEIGDLYFVESIPLEHQPYTLKPRSEGHSKNIWKKEVNKIAEHYKKDSILIDETKEGKKRMEKFSKKMIASLSDSKKVKKAKNQATKIRYTKKIADRCFVCGNPGHTDPFHIFPVGKFPEYETETWNIIPGCRHCNHTWDQGTIDQILTMQNVWWLLWVIWNKDNDPNKKHSGSFYEQLMNRKDK